ncbi:unnamed protein product [Coffea canephora]|uniref:DH200=94 genomic scaffold, scaffold_630 n=1 Tax=Coffea canephora TaxID=49390 RepID=A0A068VG95_COFCA|nr:unnamed protein product [Coffea canephora]
MTCAVDFVVLEDWKPMQVLFTNHLLGNFFGPGCDNDCPTMPFWEPICKLSIAFIILC